MGKKMKLAAVPPALPPQRAALVEHRAALADAEAAHAAAVEQIAKLRELIEGPAQTEAEIRAKIAADATALAEWVRSGKTELDGPPAFEWAGREELENRLVAQRHAAEIATVALTDAQAEVERTAGAVAEIKGRIADAERAVIMEVADEIGQRYLGLMDQVVTALTVLRALDLHLGRSSMNSINLVRSDISYPLASLPCMPMHSFGDNGTAEVNEDAAVHLVPRWAEVAKLLADDPTADPKSVFDWTNVYVPPG